LSRVIWMVVQGTIFGVPMYWFSMDPAAWKDPGLFFGLLFICWALAAILTEGSTRAWDAIRFSSLFRRIAKVGQPKRQSLSSNASARLTGELSENRQSRRIGKQFR